MAAQCEQDSQVRWSQPPAGLGDASPPLVAQVWPDPRTASAIRGSGRPQPAGSSHSLRVAGGKKTRRTTPGAP